jgi:hypothetical protein
MKKVIVMLGLVVLMGAGCTKSQPQDNTNISSDQTSAKEDAPGMRTYKNEMYKFSISIPEKNYVPECKDPQPVEVTESKGVIKIGTTYKKCSGLEDNSFFGYDIYAGQNIVDEQSANAFVKKYATPQCKVSEWDPQSGFLIVPVSDNCPFLDKGKYHVEYSPTNKTAVFWSLTQMPQFFDSKGQAIGLTDLEFIK